MRQKEIRIQEIEDSDGNIYIVTATKVDIEFVGDYSLNYPPVRSKQEKFHHLKYALEFAEKEMRN